MELGCKLVGKEKGTLIPKEIIVVAWYLTNWSEGLYLEVV